MLAKNAQALQAVLRKAAFDKYSFHSLKNHFIVHLGYLISCASYQAITCRNTTSFHYFVCYLIYLYTACEYTHTLYKHTHYIFNFIKKTNKKY